jgi:DNA primase
MESDALESLLSDLGIERVKRRNNNLMGCCPNHEESRPSWGISVTAPHLHGCLACGFTGSLRSLLRFQYKWDRERIDNLLGHTEFKATDFTLETSSEEADTLSGPRPEENIFPFVRTKRVISYLLKRGISLAVMRRAKVLYHHQDNRALFPWYINGDFYGATGRTLSSNPDEAKILGYFNIRKGHHLYLPLGRVLRTLPLVLVEGEIDSLAVLTAGFKNVAALSFGRFTKQQAQFVSELNPPEVVCFFDSDSTGSRLNGEVVKRLTSLGNIKNISGATYDFTRKLPDEKQDPASLSSSAIIKAIKSRKSLVADWSLE